MEGKGRLIHIDGLRGLAVLLMILVHAAATWEPELTGLWMGLGVLVSAAGGLAAPLFITPPWVGDGAKTTHGQKALVESGFPVLLSTRCQHERSPSLRALDAGGAFVDGHTHFA